MLILLPPSEGKTRPADGPRLDLDAISPAPASLRPARERVLSALIETSARPDALDILGVGGRIAQEVAANTELAGAGCAPAYQVYSGVLYQAGDLAQVYATGQPAEDRRVRAVVQSALFGVVDLDAPIPAYRLSMGVKLPGIGALGPWWAKEVGPVMEELAGGGMVVDARSGAYRRAWSGSGSQATIITVSAVRERGGKRRTVSHEAKRYRGILAGALLREGEAAGGSTPIDSVDYVMDVARTLVGQGSANAGTVTGIETRATPSGVELVVVTN